MHSDPETTSWRSESVREALSWTASDFEQRIPEYWGWIAVALFLLVTVDLLTTTFATAEFGLGAESNPFMRWLIAQGPVVLVAAHLGAVVLLGSFFYAIIETIRRASGRIRPALVAAFEAWIGLLIAFGLFLFANNLSAIVLHATLL